MDILIFAKSRLIPRCSAGASVIFNVVIGILLLLNYFFFITSDDFGFFIIFLQLLANCVSQTFRVAQNVPSVNKRKKKINKDLCLLKLR